MRIPNGFVPYSGRRYQGVIRADLALPDAILDEPENIGRVAGAEHLLDCAGRQIYRLPLGSGLQAPRCFTYRFTNSSFGRSLRRCYAFRTLRNALLMKEKGFATIEVLAALKSRGDLLNWTSLLVAAEIECVFELPSTGQHVFQIHPFVELNRELAHGLGAYLSEFHKAGFFHGDLKTRHILISREPGDTRFYLVDLEKCLYLPRLLPPLKALLAARDLIQLFASLPREREADCKEDIFSSYLARSRFDAGAKSIVKKAVNLYGAQGRFRQGRTVLRNLAGLLSRARP